MADERTCTGPCGRDLPLEAFAKDSRLKAGVRAVCKSCDREATAKRRRGDNPRPGALVLVPKFPDPPAPPTPPIAAESRDGSGANLPTEAQDPRREARGPVGSYAEAAEAFIDALVPPAGPADALLVRSLRGLAELLDVYSHGIDVVKDTNAIVASMLRVQRELAATRASKAGAQPAAAPAKPRASSY